MYFFEASKRFLSANYQSKIYAKEKKIYETSNQNVSPIKEKLKQTGSFY